MKTKKKNYPLTSTQNGTIALDHSQNTRPPEDKSSRHYTERDFSPAKLRGKCHNQHLIIWLVNLLTAEILVLERSFNNDFRKCKVMVLLVQCAYCRCFNYLP